jgi:hypothetical protein
LPFFTSSSSSSSSSEEDSEEDSLLAALFAGPGFFFSSSFAFFLGGDLAAGDLDAFALPTGDLTEADRDSASAALTFLGGRPRAGLAATASSDLAETGLLLGVASFSLLPVDAATTACFDCFFAGLKFEEGH